MGPCLGITRVKLQKILRTGATAVPHRLGVALASLRQDDSTVEVHLSDGTSGSYDLVVGADGIRSVVPRTRYRFVPALLFRTDGLAKRHPDTPSRDGRNDGSHG